MWHHFISMPWNMPIMNYKMSQIYILLMMNLYNGPNVGFDVFALNGNIFSFGNDMPFHTRQNDTYKCSWHKYAYNMANRCDPSLQIVKVNWMEWSLLINACNFLHIMMEYDNINVDESSLLPGRDIFSCIRLGTKHNRVTYECVFLSLI